MDNLPVDYLFRAEAWLVITTLIYFIMNGAGIFETAVIVPKWTAAPPASFEIFRGEHGIDLKYFWIVMHSIHEITFIVAIIFCWNLPSVRHWLVMLFVAHFGVRVWTLGYFAPRIMEFQKIANGQAAPHHLAGKAKTWKNLNYVRTGAFVGISLGMVAVTYEVARTLF